MKRIALHASPTLALLVVGILATAPALADKPSWAGDGRDGKHQQGDRQEGPGKGHSGYFGDRHRAVVHEYYTEQFNRGHCPPGLAKKHNGCMPPGQARTWDVGRPLPRDVVYHDLPRALVVQFGPPPTGHRYVRVASDILLIAVATGMVVDAIQNLGRI